ncbi:hypothetical protein QR680_017341 [Steinernema hermaphroditum]|uniref:EGF-like domain-containing protein n=1 Tax=Steinernema hermaphroditum TaxID=289476 RepID=A0AA39LP39_9BILA|nr:hypothetical protein QR680_017341 [Steinernema hermaphroditum]
MILRWQFLFALLFVIARAEGDVEDLAHFSDPSKGRISWVVDDSALPWVGSYYFLSSTNGSRTALLTVADASSGVVLGECSVDRPDSEWRRFFWTLSHNLLQCNVSDFLSTKIRLSNDTARSFSMRILASRGPRCIRDVIVQNEQPKGCPPTLHRNSFSSRYFQCGCPDVEFLEEEPAASVNGSRHSVPFPLFKLSPAGAKTKPSSSEVPARPNSTPPAFTLSAHPCAEHECANNGTCVVGADSKANCLCLDGFEGEHCERHVCADFCSNGGTCALRQNRPMCVCNSPFGGDRCEKIECDPECRNGGTCAYDETTVKAACECAEGFLGVDCGTPDPCAQSVCSAFGESALCVVNPVFLANPSVIPFSCECQNDIDGSMGKIDCEELEEVRRHIALLQSTPAPTHHENFTAERENGSLVGGPMHHRVTTEASTLPPTSEEEGEEEATPLFPLTTVSPLETSPEATTISSTVDLIQFLGSSTASLVPHDEEESAPTTGEESEGDNGFAIVTQGGGSDEEKSTETDETRTETSTTTAATTTSGTTATTTSTTTVTSTTTTPTTTTTTTTEAPTTTTEEVTVAPTTVEEIPEEVVQTTPADYHEEESHPTEMGGGFMSSPTTEKTHNFVENTSPKPAIPSDHEGEPKEVDKDSNRSSQKKNSQAASTTSWIVALIAIVVLLALVIASSLFIVRYVRRSRKLHGKYNPAREENALASSYSMPMTSITKEERLI